MFEKMKLEQSRKKINKEIEQLKLKQKQGKEQKELMEKLAKEEPTEEKPIVEPPQEKKTGLKNRMDEINEKLDLITQEKKATKEVKKKAFRFPFRVKSQLKKLAVKNKVLVLLLQNNGNIKSVVAEIKTGMLIIGDKLYDGNTKGVWFWNGKFPTMIVPEWDLMPLSRESLYNDAVINKRLSDPQTIIIRGMEVKELLAKSGMGGKSIIYIIIGAIVVFYVLFAGG